MDTRTYADPSLAVARRHIGALIEAYHAATGIPRSIAALIARNDPKFAYSYAEKDFRVSTYDSVLARFSGVWPEGVDWPADIPRLAPEAIEPELLEKITKRITEARALPGGADWPADIPRPAASLPANQHERS